MKKAVAPTFAWLLKALKDAQERERELGLWWLYEQNRLQNVLDRVQSAASDYAASAATTINTGRKRVISIGSDAAIVQLAKRMHEITPPPPASQQGLEDATTVQFDTLPQETSDRVQDALLLAASLGITLAMLEQLLNRSVDRLLSLVIGIDVTIEYDTFRDTLGMWYQANSDSVQAWTWTTAEDERVCFPAGTAIQTENGLKSIEDVRLGEKVLTHTGKYQRVITRSRTPRTFQTTTIRTEDGGVVSATLEHPFLVERQGQLDWIEASDLRLGDHVFRQIESNPNVRDHGITDRTVEWAIGQTYNPMTSRLKPQRFTGVAFSDTCLTMPVDTINLEAGVESWQEEINGRTPTWKTLLLPILNAQNLEAKSSVSLGFSFASECSVTSIGAKAPDLGFTWNDTKRFSTLQACARYRWTAAFIRAIEIISPVLSKDFATSLAGDIVGVSIPTSKRAARIPYGLTSGDGEILVANRTRFCDTEVSHLANLAAIRCISSLIWHSKRFATLLTHQFNRGMCNLALCGMWMLMLIQGIACLRAKMPSTSFSPGIRDCKRVTALDTNLFHTSIISQIDTHFHPMISVYNLEVEEDHTYVANGFVVHNCAFCESMDGSIHDLSESMESHPRCRCEMEPYFLDTSGSPLMIGP
jgi:hypothetical protein